MQLRYWLSITDHLPESDFENVVNQIRAVRRTRAQSTAHERAMIGACGDIYLRHASANAPDGQRRALIASLAAAGMSGSEIDKHLRGL